MRSIAGSILAAAALAAPLRGQARAPDSAAVSLVAAELAFSKASADRGMRDAYLEYLAEDAVLFRPRPQPGREWIRSRPSPPIALTWYPIFAFVSRTGDLGFTTGPYEARSVDSTDANVGHGHYVTVWQRGPDGEWKVLLDLGSPGPVPAGALPRWSPRGPRHVTDGPPRPAVDTAQDRRELLDTDRRFSSAAERTGTLTAYRAFAAADIRLLRPGVQPAVGQAALGLALSDDGGRQSWHPTSARVSAGGDLGYTYGTAVLRLPDGAVTDNAAVLATNYVRIWERRGDEWKVLLDIATPNPPVPPAPPPRRRATPAPEGRRAAQVDGRGETRPIFQLIRAARPQQELSRMEIEHVF
jgi:ketosteroid isomerase-like protein